MPISNIRGVNINWQVIGERGPWVMATTGGRRGHDEFIPMAQKIAKEGFRVMLHDRRNTGASDLCIEGDEGEEAPWLPDMYELMRSQEALPAFFCGSSAGARTSIRFYLKYPQAVRGLLLLRVTGGAFAAGRLPENYYGQFIRAAKDGGMEAVCAMDAWKERFKENPRGRDYLAKLPAEQFIRVFTRWKDIFEAGGKYPVMGVTEQELQSIKVPTIIIPGNDQTHSSASGLTAQKLIPGSELHQLPMTDQNVPLIPWPEWSRYEDEIARVFVNFMQRAVAAEKTAA
ncbi:MAG TPA: alpha/beta hydrolase [Xanthobacteraceae bacterium]|nr:alpha/beta hydrolase [Xanthobacteraceae bacterium]